MKRIVLILLLAALFVPAIDGQNRRKKRKAPRRVSSQVAKILAAVDTAEKLINTVSLDDNSLATKKTDVVLKIGSPYTVMRPVTHFYEFNSDLEDLRILNPVVVSKKGIRRAIPESEIEILLSPQAEAAPSFSSQKYLKIPFGKVEIGDTLEFSLIRKDKKAYFDGHYSDLFLVPRLGYYKEVEVHLSVPADKQIYFSADRFTGGKVSVGAGRVQYSWAVESPPAPEPGEGIAAEIDRSPKLAISTLKSYKDLADLYDNAARQKSQVTPSIQALADKVTENLKDEKAQASAIYLWVNKNVRYLAFVLDRSGWIPHSAEDIVKNRYGDCKDYSTLLQALFAAKGIKSSQVLIRSDENYWFPKIALPETFDHVIIYVPSLDLYGDATASNTRLGLIPRQFLGKTTLHTGIEDPVVTINQNDPNANRFVSETAVNFTDLGDVEAVSSNTYVGMPEMQFRPFFAEADNLGTGTSDFVEAYLGYYGLPGTGRVLSVEGANDFSKPFKLDLEIKLSNLTTFRSRGSVNFPQMLNLHNLWDIEGEIQKESRTAPLGVGAGTYIEHFSIKFPEAVRVTSVPRTVELKHPLGDYLSRYTIDGNLVKVTRELVLKKGVILPSEYKEFKSFFTKVSATYYGNIGYRSNRSYARRNQREKDRLLSANLSDLNKIDDLSPKQVRLLEAQLKRRPGSVVTRKRLITHYLYSDNTPAQESSLKAHQMWMVQNRPRESVTELFGFLLFRPNEEAGTDVFKEEWAKNVAKYPDDAAVLFNAVTYSLTTDVDYAIKLALKGEERFPDRFEFLYVLFKRLNAEALVMPDSLIGSEEKKAKLEEALAKGIKTLELLKSERTFAREVYRAMLLPDLADLAFSLGRLEQSSAFAKELILEFGDDITKSWYESAAHKGNIILGKIALEKGDTPAARKFLEIAINVPVRSGKETYLMPDLALAESLLVAGQRDAVVRYLEECEKLRATDNVVLKRWQAAIKKGQTPSLDQIELY